MVRVVIVSPEVVRGGLRTTSGTFAPLVHGRVRVRFGGSGFGCENTAVGCAPPCARNEKAPRDVCHAGLWLFGFAFVDLVALFLARSFGAKAIFCFASIINLLAYRAYSLRHVASILERITTVGNPLRLSCPRMTTSRVRPLSRRRVPLRGCQAGRGWSRCLAGEG